MSMSDEAVVALQGFSGTFAGEYIKDTGCAEKFNVGEYWVDLMCVSTLLQSVIFKVKRWYCNVLGLLNTRLGINRQCQSLQLYLLIGFYRITTRWHCSIELLIIYCILNIGTPITLFTERI